MLVLLGMYEKYCDILFLQLLQFYRVTQTLLQIFYFGHFNAFIHHDMYLYVIFFVFYFNFTQEILTSFKFKSIAKELKIQGNCLC